MDFRLLGPVEVSDGNGPLPLGGPKPRTLLVHLLLEPNQRVPADRLIQAVWEDHPPEAARNSLQTYVSHLRSALGADRLEGGAGGYLLHADRNEIDMYRFEQLLSRARDLAATDAAAAVQAYDDALALWRGPALDDLADQPSLRAEIARLEELRLTATEERIARALELGRHAEVIPGLERLLARHPLRETLWGQLMVALYRSRRHPNLIVVDKRNGGKADALNAGINISRYPLFCSLDADSILERDSLRLVVQPFLNDPLTVACSGTVRIANGCKVTNGYLTAVGLPANFLALVQIVEYLRAFLFGRLGWSPMNALLIISGAFGMFHKDTVVMVGGYHPDTIGEDMELVVRLHRQLRLQGKPYRITFVPDPVCWTEAPEDLYTLKNQRIRWQRGLCESLTKNKGLLFHPKGGVVGWLAFPFMALFEWLGPVIEVAGSALVIVGFMLGFVSFEAWSSLLLVAISLGILLSVSAVLLEEISFHAYPKPRHVLLLFLAAIAENFGYRQLNTVWRIIGLARWLRGGKASWGEMSRKASWQIR